MCHIHSSCLSYFFNQLLAPIRKFYSSVCHAGKNDRRRQGLAGAQGTPLEEVTRVLRTL